SEKLWGIPCTDLDADFAAQRIKKLSLSEAIKAALFGNIGNKHKSLIDQFDYPTLGTGMVYDRMADFISARGGIVHLGTPVQGIRTARNNDQTALILQDGEVRTFDHIIS